MCTVSWSLGGEGLSLSFNRDERKTRLPARDPKVMQVGSLKAVAPIDPVGEGTWIAANERGVCAFVLNNYAAAMGLEDSGRWRSRGGIPLELVTCASLEQACRRLEGMRLQSFRPFLAGIANGDAVVSFAWDGQGLSFAKPNVSLMTTSSYKSLEVQAYRLRKYTELLRGRAFLADEERRAFHTQADADDPAFSPLMLREESRTHSVTQVTIENRSMEMTYEPIIGETRTLGERVKVSLSRSR